MRHLSILLLGALSLLIGSPSARADIYALGHDADAMVLRGVADGELTAARAPACCALAMGTATFDPANRRAYFIEETATGAALVRFNYAVNSSSRVAITAGYRVTHLEYDAANARLLALAIDQISNARVMAAIDVASGALTVRATLAAPCCALRAGVSVLTATAPTRLITVGKAATASEQVLVFDFDANTGPQAFNIANAMQLGDLARHPLSGQIYGLAHDPTGQLTLPIAMSSTSPYAITNIGAGNTNCCYVLTGAAVIDRNGPAIVAIGSAYGASLPMAQRFDLATGARTQGVGLPGVALVEEFGLATGVMFANGFE